MSDISTDAGTGKSLPLNYHSTASRIFSIDVLRGVALLGILLISIWEFGGFSMNDQTGLQLSKKGFDYYLFSTMQVLFEGKMRGLFALIFGACILSFLTKPNQPSPSHTQELFIRRQMWLIVFGLVNAFVLLWPGDILFHYGVVGILLFPFFRFSKKALLIGAILTTLIYCGKMYWNYADDKKALKKYTAVMLVEKRIKKDSTDRHRKDSLAGLPKDSIRVRDSVGMKKDTLTKEQQQDKGAWEGLTKGLKYDSTKAGVKAENKSMRSSYVKVWKHLMERSQNKESMWLYQIGIWDIGSLMLLGMFLFAIGFFRSHYSTPKYIVFAIAGISGGVLLALLRLQLHYDKLVDYEKYIGKHLFAPQQFFPLERLFLVVGLASLVLLLIRIQLLKWLWDALSAAGRMAFTNYFLQSIICTLFFYGYGFGYFGRLSLQELYFFVAELWLIQIVFSIFWLRYYEYGPVEWLWRSLVHRKRFSNKKNS